MVKIGWLKIVFLILLTFLGVIYIQYKKYNVLIRIASNEKVTLSSTFQFLINQEYKKRFLVQELIDSTINVTLIVDKFNPNNEEFIYLKSDSMSGFLKAPISFRLINKSNTDTVNYINYAIDLDLFNLYAETIRRRTMDQFLFEYLNLLSNSSGINNCLYSFIDSEPDIDSIYRNFPLIKSYTPKQNKLEIDLNAKEKYIWFLYYGVYSFEYQLINNMFSIKFKFKGYLNNEFLKL